LERLLRYLKIVDCGEIVNARHAAVHQTEKEVLVIFPGIPQVLAYQYEVRFEGSENKQHGIFMVSNI